MAFPFVLGAGRLPDNPSKFPRDYGRGLLIVLGVVWLTVVVRLGIARAAPVPGSVVKTVLGAVAALAVASPRRVRTDLGGPQRPGGRGRRDRARVGRLRHGLRGAYCGCRARWAVPLILGGGLALQLAAAGGPPRSSDDLYRYVWDGRVQAAGIDPYRYAPAAPELAGLRDPFLWPARANWCVQQSTVDQVAGCTRINRPTCAPSTRRWPRPPSPPCILWAPVTDPYGCWRSWPHSPPRCCS